MLRHNGLDNRHHAKYPRRRAVAPCWRIVLPLALPPELTAIDYFSLPRTTRPADWFERILPALPLRLPTAELAYSAVVHVVGPGGGSWSHVLRAGKLHIQAGVRPPVAVQYSMTVAHFRELLFGAVRERHIKVLAQLKMPQVLPDFSRVAADPTRIAAVAQLRGSLAFELRDRSMADVYRYVLTLGGGPAQLDHPDTTIEVDLDDLTALAMARTPPLKVISSGKLRVKGNTDLPISALTALLGRAP